MTYVSLRYRFRQPFRAPARAVYDWCTDFREDDTKMYPRRTDRTLRWLTDDALLMTDITFPNGKRRRVQRLVRTQPSELSWTNTHVAGPFTYSQYWYRIVPDGPRRSHLDFRGLRVISSPKRLDRRTVARLTEEERQGDATLWRRHLAPVANRDLAR